MNKKTFEVKRIIDVQEFAHDLTSVMIGSKIFKYYKQFGFFPNEISKEA